MRAFAQIDPARFVLLDRLDDGGAWQAKSPIDGGLLRIIASIGGGWDHVPNWAEMEFVKRAFFAADEVAVQYHVPPDDHVSFHPYALHIWRPQTVALPRPPWYLVGPRGRTPEDMPEDMAEALRALDAAGLA